MIFAIFILEHEDTSEKIERRVKQKREYMSLNDGTAQIRKHQRIRIKIRYHTSSYVGMMEVWRKNFEEV